VDAQGAYIPDSDLRGVNLQGAKLQGINLWGSQLQGADLTGADLSGALLERTQFDEHTRLPDGRPWSPEVDLGRYI
jgi:uncharacterized protein YjbI with pentapeptide repeats